MKLSIQAGATSQSVNVFIRDSSSTTGAGLTGLAYNTASLTAYYTHAGANATATSITLATLAAVNSAYSSGGFKEIDSTNMPGWYRFDIPNACLATSKGRSVAIHLKGATNMAPLPIEIELTGWDNQSTTDGGLSKLTSLTFTVAGKIDANVYTWNGTAVTAPNTAGTPIVDVGRVNNVSTSSVTTINANQGTTQPINFTGTGASALAKSDMVDIAGAAVSTSTAQLGVNVVNAAGTAWASGAITSSVLATDSITSTQLAASAVSEIWASVTDSSGVTTLLSRIPSGLFSGITSLAQWLGLLAGKQTGNTTARTEIRATGAGSGTFDETTDSQEALRDRGDSFWITATGFSTHTAADVWAVATRVLTAGTNIQLPSNGLANVTSWTVGITGNITGNLSGSVGSVSGAVGSVTGNVGGNVTGSVGSVVGLTASNLDTTVSSRSVAGDAMALTSGERTTLAQAIFKLDLSAITGEASRSLLNAVRFLRNKWSISGTTLTVTKEDDSTAAWTGTVTTNASADPITGNDPS